VKWLLLVTALVANPTSSGAQGAQVGFNQILADATHIVSPFDGILLIKTPVV